VAFPAREVIWLWNFGRMTVINIGFEGESLRSESELCHELFGLINFWFPEAKTILVYQYALSL
jgi:hypothetical protein